MFSPIFCQDFKWNLFSFGFSKWISSMQVLTLCDFMSRACCFLMFQRWITFFKLVTLPCLQSKNISCLLNTGKLRWKSMTESTVARKLWVSNFFCFFSLHNYFVCNMSMRSVTISFVEKEDMESFANICIRFVSENIAKIAELLS